MGFVNSLPTPASVIVLYGNFSNRMIQRFHTEVLHEDPDTSLANLALAPANAQYFLGWLAENFEESNERATLRLAHKQMQTNYTIATG